jgi:Ca-activated chloride channel homolog
VNPPEGRGRRRRRIRVGLLLAIAIVLPVGLMAGLTAQAVVARTSCTNRPLQVRVAVAQDIFPAVSRVGQLFNRQGRQAVGRCVRVQVSQEQPAAVAGQVDGQSSNSGLPAADAWIPDSSLWVDVARAFPLGAQRVQPTGINVAKSPLMIVMPPSAAAQIPQFNNSVGWNFLLAASEGGAQAPPGVRVEMPDPTQSAAGLATLIEVGRLLGNGTAARTALTHFVLSVQSSAQFSDPASLAAFVTQAGPPLNGHPVTVTSEQAVLGYDRAHPSQPLAARYPSGSDSLATQELDYPYVLTSTNQAEMTAAKEFGTLLQQGYAASLIHYYGFRTDNGVPAALPASLAQQPLKLASATSPAETQTVLQTWQRLQSGARDLAVIDVSSAMSGPSGLPGVTLEQEMTQAAELGLSLFPDSTQIGLWEFASAMTGALPYKPLVGVGPLPGELGLISRRQQIQQIDVGLRPVPGPAALNQTILAAYQQMQASYQPGVTNAVIVMTAGVDNAPHDMPVAQLVAQLKSLSKPSRPVELIIVMVGNRGNLRALQQIATAGGGAAFGVTNPAQIGQVFFEGVSRRICQSNGCQAP